MRFVINESYSYLHVLWSSLVYGGLFIAAYRLSQQAEATQRLLASAEIARQTTESELSAAQLKTLQGQVDPAFLLRVITEIEHRYADDPNGMEQLLSPLVEFLRMAMPGVRGASSTMVAEWRLAQLFVKLLTELEPLRWKWSLQTDSTLPDAAFPALLLLPILERLAAAEGGPEIKLQLHQVDGCHVLRLDRMLLHPGRWLAPELEYRLGVALRGMYGLDWTLTIGEAPSDAALLLTLPLRDTGDAQGVRHE